MARPRLSNRLRPYLEDDVFTKINAAADAFDEHDLEEAIEVTHETSDVSDEVIEGRERILVAYVVGLGVLSWLIGLTFAIPVFMVAMMVGYSQEKPKYAVTVAAIMTGFLLVLFNLVLRQPLHFGLLEGLM
jgi:uncharacterized membrane protein